MKSKSTAVLLAILFGGLDIHHFYLGNTKQGLCYLIPWILLCWTVFFPVISWIIETIEGIVLANKSQDEFDIEYNLNQYKNRPPSFINNSYTTSPKEQQQSKTDQLIDLKKLYDAGVLTEEEFNKQKSKILNS